MTVAVALSPNPRPCAIPTASAMTFFVAPPSSQPTTSGLVYGRKNGLWQRACRDSATDSSVHAITEAAGWRLAISCDRLGPDKTATRPPPIPVTSSMTSVIRLAVPTSTPFIRLITTAPSGMCFDQTSRLALSDCDGTASTITEAPAHASSGSWVALTLAGSSTPGR